MDNTTADRLSKAKALRTQALALLTQAQALDGYKPYAIPEAAPLSSPVFLLWSDVVPNDDVASAVITARQEEGQGAILLPIPMDDICGVSALSRLDDFPMPKDA